MPRGKVSHKKEKFAERILQEIGVFLRKEMADKRLQFVSVTKVEMNNDYSVAILHWDTFDNHKRGEVKETLEKIRGRFRKHLASILDVRTVPMIKFQYDAQFVAEEHITKLLEDEKLGEKED